MYADHRIIWAIMTDEERSDRRRTLIIAGIIILVVWILAGFLWYVIMAERLKSGPPLITVVRLPVPHLLWAEGGTPLGLQT